MKVFICHSSRDKSLIREIRSELPKRINDWLDEDALLIGQSIPEILERVINEEVDYLIFFVSGDALASSWVKKELTWALERERTIGREFILPVVIEDVWERVPEPLRNRNFIRLHDFERASVRGLAERLRDQLDQLIHLELTRRDAPASAAAPGLRVTTPSHALTRAENTCIAVEIVRRESKTLSDGDVALRKVFKNLKASSSDSKLGASMWQLDDEPESVSSAIQSVTTFVRDLNTNIPDTPIFLRVGIDVSAEAARRLCERCPVGNVAIGEGIYQRLGPWRDLFRPAVDGVHIKYVLSQRPFAPQERSLVGQLSSKQLRAVPAIRLLSWTVARPAEGLTTLAARLRDDSVIVFGDTSWSSRSALMSAATSDAVGITEAMAPRDRDNLRVGIDEWEDTADLVGKRNTLVVGSGVTNLYALILNQISGPVRFAVADGRSMDCISAGSVFGEGRQHFGPHTGEGIRGGQELTDCAGLLVGMKSVFNPENIMIWAAGINGMGTQAVAALLKDLLLSKVRLPDSVVGCVVTPALPGDVIKDYYRRLRVSDYRIICAVDADGRTVKTE